MGMEGYKKRGLIIIGLAAVIVAGSFWGHLHRASAPAPAAGGTRSGAGGLAAVYVTGAVKNPGLYRVSPDSRVSDALAAAGGLAPGADSDRVNIAQTVHDGMQVHVPQTAQAGKPAAGRSARVNINLAGKGELETLPGIGPVLAQRIIDYRQAHGVFRDISELKKVTGIGESKFSRIKELITL